MASSSDNSRVAFLCVESLLLLLVAFSHTAFSQVLGSPGLGPTIASCQPQLLSLVPCMPFIQGAAQSPAESCCRNLDQINRQHPNCVCLLLSSSYFNSLPINRTLAFQLPQLCRLQDNAMACAGGIVPPVAPSERAPKSPAAQVSFGSRNESSIASSPAIALGPVITNSGSSQHKGSQLLVAINSAFIGVILTALLISGRCL